MVNVYQKKVLMLAVYAAEIMMKNGAEIYRVEDTVTRICKACSIPYVEVFATPTGIFVSIDKGGENDDTQTYIKRIKGSGTDLSKISRVNQFSREFATTDLSVEAGMDILRSIDAEKPYPLAARTISAAMVCSFFCIVFGGKATDFCVAILSGTVCYLLSELLKRMDIHFFIHGFCCCGVAALMALTAAAVIPGASYDPIIIGSIMIFVPGVALTNSIRDFLSGDMLSGLARMTEALLTAVALATGAGVTMTLWETMGGVVL